MTLKDALKNPWILSALLFLWLALLALCNLALTKAFLTNSNAMPFFSIVTIISIVFIILFGVILPTLSGQPLPFLTRIQMCFIGTGMLQIVRYAFIFIENYNNDPSKTGLELLSYPHESGFFYWIGAFAIFVISSTGLTFLGEKLYFKFKDKDSY